MPDLNPEQHLFVSALVIVLVAVAAVALGVCIAGLNGDDDDDPICWPESPDCRTDAAFFERRQRLEREQRAFRRARAWKFWL